MSELSDYINERIDFIHQCNRSDHKPTHHSEIEKTKAQCGLFYERGTALMDQIGAEDLARCLKLYNTRHEYRSHYLYEMTILGQRVVVPKYVGLIEEMRKLRKAIA